MSEQDILCLSTGGDKQGHIGDPLVHSICLRGVHERARRTASHLQTSQRLTVGSYLLRTR